MTSEPAAFFHSDILKRFTQMRVCKKMAHAYLFSGPTAVGKSETGLAIAQLIHCTQVKDEQPCQICANCQRILNDNHPDVHVLKSQPGENIKIEQIRTMIKQMQTSAYEANEKFFLLQNAENLTEEAANALLKSLEEPSIGSLMILTTAHIEMVTETIVSRCHVIKFVPCGYRDMEQYLVHHDRLPSDESHFLTRFAEGCLREARQHHRDGLFSKKNRMLDQFIFESSLENFEKEWLSKKDDRHIILLLTLLISWFRDLLFVKNQIPSGDLIHQDRIRDLESLSKEYSTEKIRAVIDDIIEALKMARDRFNMKTALAVLKERL